MPNLGELNNRTKNFIWKFRYYISKHPKKEKWLTKFLHSVNWTNSDEEKEALSLLKNWGKVSFDEAIHLFSTFFSANNFYTKNVSSFEAMEQVREYAVKIIADINTKKFSMILLQLVQVLRYEKL